MTHLDEALQATDYSNVPNVTCRITQRYENIVTKIRSCSDNAFPKSKFRRFLKPFWDQHLKNLHANMRNARRLWISEGRPRGNNHASYRKYKAAKCQFRSHHRLCAEDYLSSLNAEIDQFAELDSAYFWKMVNGRRKLSSLGTGCQIEFNGRIHRDPEEIAIGWGNYFHALYSDTERPHFDPLYRNIIDTRLENVMQELSNTHDSDSVTFTVDMVKETIQKLKKKKACGCDNVYNEHLLYGTDKLFAELVLFSDMYNYSYIPKSMKRGTIITLHKGGRKSKKDPNNYRAITLTSAVLKLFERLVLDKLYDSLERPFSSMQGGFRPATGCNMSSLMLKECVSFAKEHDSKLFACFLDIHKAFDKVWHNGLFVKLYSMGIRSKLLKSVINLHSNVESSVFHCGFFSNAFPVLQGTRQGGVISSFMYLCYIDDLNLLGQLCRNDTKCWITPVFHIRLESYLNNRNKQIGFFCVITRLLEKYGLAAYLENFRNHGTFPCKTAWNKLIKEKIRQYETVQWHNRISVAEFSLFTRLHEVLQPHMLWYRSKENPKISHCYISLMQMITYLWNNFNGSFICTYCKREYSNLRGGFNM